MTNIYALYKGEEFVLDGTSKKIAELLGIKVSTLMFYKSPAYKKRGAKIKKEIDMNWCFLKKVLKKNIDLRKSDNLSK